MAWSPRIAPQPHWHETSNIFSSAARMLSSFRYIFIMKWFAVFVGNLFFYCELLKDCNRVGAMVRALAFHRCVPSSIPQLYAIYRLECFVSSLHPTVADLGRGPSQHPLFVDLSQASQAQEAKKKILTDYPPLL